MRKQMRKAGLVSTMLVVAMLASAVAARAADTFQKPTKEELEMKSLPGYPGAAAVVLFREEITKDDMHVVQHYERIKILTEEGKKYANVELGFISTQATGIELMGNDKTIGDISARTIHADGTIIPFTGKPYSKVVEKGKAHDEEAKEDFNFKRQEMVFTLPDAEIGSIIEYRYSTRIGDHVFEAPDWYIQGELYVKAAHFQWYPTVKELVDGETQAPINSISWYSILPEGVKVENTNQPAGDGQTHIVYNLNVKAVPPVVEEDFMPPIASYSYRVLFNFTEYRSAADYWTSEGKRWSKRMNAFVNVNSAVTAATQTTTAGATTQDAKLRKIYAAIMAMENTQFTRRREVSEGKVNNAADVFSHERGTPEQLTQTFVSMARAAGMKAYLMTVPDRAEDLFTPTWLSFRQFDALVAVVNVDGKEVYFDPGERDCPYGHLAWEHTFVQGLRQTDDGTGFARTPGDSYTVNRTARVANLNMDDQGVLTGAITLTFTGATALGWRQAALQGDTESLNRQLRVSLEHMLPASLEVKVGNIENLQAYEQPLVVHYTVKGIVATPTGKRLVVPADLFLTSEHATFPSEKRVQAVYFHFPVYVQDALRINLPGSMTVEAVPDAATSDLPNMGKYNMTVTSAPNNVTTRRNFLFGMVVIVPGEYATLRKFYMDFEAKDKESVVLKPTATAGAPAAK